MFWHHPLLYSLFPFTVSPEIPNEQPFPQGLSQENNQYPLKTATMVDKPMETKGRYSLGLTVIIKKLSKTIRQRD